MSALQESHSASVTTFTLANFHNVCRVCFCDKPPLLNIFSSQFKGESIADLITICIPKQVHDISLPNTICKECLTTLVKFKAFISQFQYADTLLTFVRDQLNNGNQEVRINNLTKPDLGRLINDYEKKAGSNNLPKEKIQIQKANKEIGKIKGGQNAQVNNAAVKSSTNLIKAKSKSTEHLSNGKRGDKKLLLSLPLLKTCNTCKVDFLDIKIFENHMKENHPNKVLKCSICSPMKYFFDAEELTRHKIASHDMIVCKICDSLVAKANIAKHNEKLHAKTTKMDENKQLDLLNVQPGQKLHSTIDDLAGLKVDEENLCKLHIIRTENKLPESILPCYTTKKSTATQCNTCSKIFEDSLYKEHVSLCQPTKQKMEELISTKPTKDKEIKCILCKNMPFPSYTKFEKHCSQHHADTTSCNICRTNVLYSKDAFKLHKLNVHGFVACSVCMCTIKPENMQKHMEIHSRVQNSS